MSPEECNSHSEVSFTERAAKLSWQVPTLREHVCAGDAGIDTKHFGKNEMEMTQQQLHLTTMNKNRGRHADITAFVIFGDQEYRSEVECNIQRKVRFL
jgi:hypothetical protein